MIFRPYVIKYTYLYYSAKTSNIVVRKKTNNMNFRTQVKPEKVAFTFSHTTPVVLMGSCFAENIGERLADFFFPVDSNPFGTLYNPASLAEGLRMLIDGRQLSASDLFSHEGVFHSFTHHSRFSAATEEVCLRKINERLQSSSIALREAERLIITFGTAWVYKLRSNERVVANCHKLPDSMFERVRLTVGEIVADWRKLLETLQRENPRLKILFTISPVRHWKDGAHGNQLSKSTLLLAVDELRKQYPDQAGYFPAYEIMMDELRDYRFYADDMLHPSSLAVDYIWESFATSYFTTDSRMLLKELARIRSALNHRPFNPENEPYRAFLKQTIEKAECLNQKIGENRLSPIVKELENRLSQSL